MENSTPFNNDREVYGGAFMFPVIKGASYVLVNTPDMIIHNGTTQTLERETHPDSEYLKKLPEHIRSFEDSVAYPANQAYIGGITPKSLLQCQGHGLKRKLKTHPGLQSTEKSCHKMSFMA